MDKYQITFIVAAIWIAFLGAFIILYSYRRNIRMAKYSKQASRARRGDVEMVAGLRAPPNVYMAKGHRGQHTSWPTLLDDEPSDDPKDYGMLPMGGRLPARRGQYVKKRPADIIIPSRV